MNTKMIFGTVALGALLLFQACKKETPAPADTTSPTPTVTPQASASALKSFLENNLNASKQTFTISATNPSLITGQQGTTIQFYANSFETMAGVSVTGDVEVELIEALDKRDMLLKGLHTIGRQSNGAYAPLISGGEMKLTVRQNGQKLRLKSGVSYQMTMPATGGVDPNMTLFYGDETSDTLVWTQADSANFFGQGGTYNAFCDSMNWVNCDFFYSDPNPKTKVFADLPDGFNNTNCLLYVVFDGMNSLTNIAHFEGGLFTTGPYYKLPEGLAVHFVAFAIINNVPHYAIQAATIGTNHIETITSLSPTTEAAFATAIGNLP